MTIQFTIIGMDRIGISFGLAMADRKDHIQRCGYDPDPIKVSGDESKDAFDKKYFRLSEAVNNADVILLSLPIDQLELTIKDMAEDLKEDVVVINTSNSNAGITEIITRLLPERCHFINVTPMLNGAYLHENSGDEKAAHADLFAHAEMMITANPETHPAAIRIASELTDLVGAHPCFMDSGEAGGISSRIELLPKLTAAALLMTTMQASGWQDTRRLTSTAYAMSTDAIQLFEETEHPSLSLLTNRENSMLAVDGMITSLMKIKSLLEAGDQTTLDKLLLELKNEHSEWADLRSTGDWDKPDRNKTERPPSTMRRLFGNPSKLMKK